MSESPVYTNLRRGIDGLVIILQNRFQLDHIADALFLFCGRRTDSFRLCTGIQMVSCCCKCAWSEASINSLEAGKGCEPQPAAVSLVLEGMCIHQPKAHQPVKNNIYS